MMIAPAEFLFVWRKNVSDPAHLGERTIVRDTRTMPRGDIFTVGDREDTQFLTTRPICRVEHIPIAYYLFDIYAFRRSNK